MLFTAAVLAALDLPVASRWSSAPPPSRWMKHHPMWCRDQLATIELALGVVAAVAALTVAVAALPISGHRRVDAAQQRPLGRSPLSGDNAERGSRALRTCRSLAFMGCYARPQVSWCLTA